ncbi:DUF4041 domain-containing protein [Amycolatopsis speibonae]|uniref:DUF4041 domain-containing protein n=1 Tax=Amycolatopsis speibonae TaxID=1450224 RepID=A0ABV7P0L2_9PSEU
MALFGNNQSAELVGLQQQLAVAHATIAELRGWVGHLRGAGTPALETDLRHVKAAVEQAKAEHSAQSSSQRQLAAELESWRAQLVETRELALLQQMGIYEYVHPLEDALACKDALSELRLKIKAAAKADAVTCQVDWAVNGSVKEGQKLGRDMAKLMIRAYNAEADNAVRVVKPHTVESVKNRLTTTRDTIGKFGTLMRIAISGEYHRLRLREIDLTADYLMKLEVEREAKGDTEGWARAKDQLAAVDDAIAGVERRAANVRAGYVYVISNLGAFGPDVVKIGMTRRLEPMDRVRELGDASVPFRFDVHGLFFSEDAVALETALHQQLATDRVNRVNPRREFFHATPGRVKELLTELGDDHILEYKDTADAVEWRASRRDADPASTGRPSAVASNTDAGDLSSDGDLT